MSHLTPPVWTEIRRFFLKYDVYKKNIKNSKCSYFISGIILLIFFLIFNFIRILMNDI